MAMNFTVTEPKNALTEFVDRLNEPAPAFPTVEDFNTGSASESTLKWKELAQDRIYQIFTVQRMEQHSFYLSKLLMGSVTMLGHVVC